MENKINKTTKRLLSASYLGITFSYCGGGHRWISFNDVEDDVEPMHEKLERHGILPNDKVYGNIIDCLNFVDFLLEEMGEKTLEDMFYENGWGLDDEFVGNNTPWEESETETKEYFKERIKIYGKGN